MDELQQLLQQEQLESDDTPLLEIEKKTAAIFNTLSPAENLGKKAILVRHRNIFAIGFFATKNSKLFDAITMKISEKERRGEEVKL